MYFLDTETCGLHGVPVLLQYAVDDGEIILHNIWLTPIRETMDIIEDFCRGDVCGFNLAFDWFHLCKIYNMFRLMPDSSVSPVSHIKELADLEKKATLGPCLKPRSACDLMLHARKGPYQSTMNRNNIKIKKVPTILAHKLAEKLDGLIPMKDIYFARKNDPKRRWQVVDIIDDFGDVNVEFKDIVLRFAPSSALKALAVDALGADESTILKFVNVEPPGRPTELGYAPFDMEDGWSHWVEGHVYHWEFNEKAREYAELDVVYTRDLYKFFGSPDPGDVDSDLACMVAAVRWRGFALDIPQLEKLCAECKTAVAKLTFNVQSPAVCRKYMMQELSETEQAVMKIDGKITTGAVVLEEIAKWRDSSTCLKCDGMGCEDCSYEGLVETGDQHPAALRAQEILDARSALKEIELFEKLLLAGRFHASFKVIGALSSRMAGADGLNAQGIKRAKHVRSCFTLADEGLELDGGDFDSFEIGIMDAAYGDPKMHEELCSDKKIHAIWGARYFFPHLSYEEIVASHDTAKTPWEDFYVRSKGGVFAICYFGEAHTLITRVGLSEEVANAAYDGITKDYPHFTKKRNEIISRFSSMQQPGGIGSKVEWHDPEDFIASLTGFKRYFTLENQVCKALFDLAESPPKEWNDIKIKVMRRDRQQTASGAIRSALFAAAFALQAGNTRAAGNHKIQSTGAELTKELEHDIWSLQPIGISNWRVQPMQIHVEVMVALLATLRDAVRDKVVAFTERRKEIIPLLGISWMQKLSSWAGKG